ncbi:MAG: B12-binding domain-containing radical SAM protein [bacterium]
MARILFIQNQTYTYPGIYYICGILKSTGHHYKVVIDKRDGLLEKEIKDFSPDFAGFPCLTGIHKLVLESAAKVKKYRPDCKTLVGGIHPTLCKDFVLNKDIDFICRGEGEEATKELLDSWEMRSEDYSHVQNISWKREREVSHNKMRNLVIPMDELPFPDYSAYKDIPLLANTSYPMVWLTRGCPFSCAYCHNHNQRELFKGKGRYTRSFSIDRIFSEVQSVIANYPRTQAVLLGADHLGGDKTFIEQLFTGFSHKFDIPYTCQMRPEFITEDIAKLLRDTNCHMIAFGIESGSERIRSDLLQRKYTNEKILEVSNLLKKYKIKFRTFNMVGFPSETRMEMFETLKINQTIKPNFPWCSIYTPYPETKLADYAISNNYLDADFNFDNVPYSFFNDTILKNVDRDYILNFHSFFQLMVLFPWISPLMKIFLKFPHNIIFKLIFKVTYSFLCIKAEKRTFLSFIKLAWANRRLFR